MRKSILTIVGLLLSMSVFASQTPKLDIVDTAVSSGQFKTLVAAVSAAGLVETLKGPGPFTVFAPTDAAFAKLPAGTVEALLKNIPKLSQILTYHVVSGKLSAKNLKNLGRVATIEGTDVEITYKDNTLFINDAQVVMYNINTKNGVIQVIDSVLLP